MHLVVFAWLQKREKEREVVLGGKGKRHTLFCHFIGWSSPQPKLLAYIGVLFVFAYKSHHVTGVTSCTRQIKLSLSLSRLWNNFAGKDFGVTAAKSGNT